MANNRDDWVRDYDGKIKVPVAEDKKSGKVIVVVIILVIAIVLYFGGC